MAKDVEIGGGSSDNQAIKKSLLIKNLYKAIGYLIFKAKLTFT